MTYATLLGITVLQTAPQRTHLSLTVSGTGLNMHGTAHGGLLFSLADEAFALISNLEAQAVAVETHLSFFRAVQQGDVLHALATPERVGRTLATYRVELRRCLTVQDRPEDGELVALFLGTVSRRARENGAAEPSGA
ncbi:hotdog domain-containing protein [Deinococcus aquatilis]|jgi:acyl-CoA thioesterase|uniref:hotdog domain-containing protein n=1 Tax=Deinococcus aquatilis TaxID=519440 RepID=UPI00035C3D9E|nr:hotdog domain-containing protein [Deinococcus aquatilis]